MITLIYVFSMACRRGKELSRDSTSQVFIINSIKFLNNKRIELTK